MFTRNREGGNHIQFNLYLPYSPTEAIYFLGTILGIYFTKSLKPNEGGLLLNCENFYVHCRTLSPEKKCLALHDESWF